MAAIISQKANNDVVEQLETCRGVTGDPRRFIIRYLAENNIKSLNDITICDLVEYRKYIKKLLLMGTCKNHYECLLEQVSFAYQISLVPSLEETAEKILKNRAVRNKVIGFMAFCGVYRIDDIDYEVREKYRDYLEKTISQNKVLEYLKGMDVLKLEAIKDLNINNPIKIPALKYINKKIFLLYHPRYEVANSFFYIRNKEELVFDFSLDASNIMKRQIFKMLDFVLNTNNNRHDRRERFLIPLNLLYKFCVTQNINDIEDITENQVKEFRESVCGKGPQGKKYFQIIDNIRKFLFNESTIINWHANNWYVDNLIIDESRINPSRLIKKFSFGEVENQENRRLMQEYLKYRIGISRKSSIQTIRCEYYYIISFLRYLDTIGKDAQMITPDEFKDYIRILDDKKLQPEGYNKSLQSLSKFYEYLIKHEEMEKIPFYYEYFLKKTYAHHNDRAVSENTQEIILEELKKFPMELRLMYLNLYCVGLRVSEVCSIRGGGYYWDGKDAWLKIYQPKMKMEKSVPIPKTLFLLMRKYINDNNILPANYIFKNKKGGAYDAGTFSKKFQRGLYDIGITDYKFRPHDFRHTRATEMYSSGVPIETIRDYLGHRESDMTKKYLDYMENVLDKANETFLERHNLGSIAT